MHARFQQPYKLLEQKKVFTKEKSWSPTGLVWYNNMAAVSLFWNHDIMYTVHVLHSIKLAFFSSFTAS